MWSIRRENTNSCGIWWEVNGEGGRTFIILKEIREEKKIRQSFHKDFCLSGKTHTVAAPLAEPLTRRSFECLRYDFTFAHINADLNAFHI